jgi:hypothetical protein
MSIDRESHDPGSAGSVDALTDKLQRCARIAVLADAAFLEAAVAVADRHPAGFDADLVAFSLNWTRTAARHEVELGRYLQRVVKPVWAAMRRGDVDLRRARVFYDVLCTVDDDVAFAIALQHADRACEWTTTQLRDRLRRAVLRADPDGAARRTARSVEQRRVAMVPDRESTASLFGSCLPAARATAAFERIDAFARARRAGGDTRTLEQLRADTFLDLLEGVDVGASPVHRRGVVELSVPWSVLARGIDPAAPEPVGGSDRIAFDNAAGVPTHSTDSDEPATLAGFGPAEAPTARANVNVMLGRRDIAWRFRVDGTAGELRALGVLPRPRHHQDLAGLLEHIRDAALATCGAPAEADPQRRTPGPALSRWIRARDRMCRAPGCRAPASACDIDHTVDYRSGGLTKHDNLALVCRHHHRLKHEAGWRVEQPTPGTLTWMSPHGHRFTRSRE